MFGLFKKKSKVEILQKKYQTLMNEWHQLSKINRKESDQKYAEAQRILSEIETLKNI
ncbi:Lacal_2735 family protein [Marinifilum caeruleilacunae]|uniref:Lacal_2735 family protein n=1 Tax=Marinifilum caeruleilacunae TaxID=2499076 RepID=A0ABX1WYM4_9BACT|nr:Lacal_2735 family protein [Marinifilum caeruleilacunae]NOU61179.1 Lacal_2735 family protein [Marinifilum caeruleilacunae]